MIAATSRWPWKVAMSAAVPIGALSVLSSADMTAIRSSAHRADPSAAHVMSGVSCWLFRAVIEARPTMSCEQALEWEPRQARCNGVLPSSSGTETWHSWMTSIITVALWPRVAAM